MCFFIFFVVCLVLLNLSPVNPRHTATVFNRLATRVQVEALPTRVLDVDSALPWLGVLYKEFSESEHAGRSQLRKCEISATRSQSALATSSKFE